MLDGFVVNIGDNVWDVLLANTGIVTAIDGGTLFTVSYGPQGTLTYGAGGTIAGRKRAYWRDPVLTLPEKNDPQWALLQAVVGAVRSS